METNDQWLERQLRQIWEQLDIQAKCILKLEKAINRSCHCNCHKIGLKFLKPDPVFFHGEAVPCCRCTEA